MWGCGGEGREGESERQREIESVCGGVGVWGRGEGGRE